jgi:hypothetical protein
VGSYGEMIPSHQARPREDSVHDLALKRLKLQTETTKGQLESCAARALAAEQQYKKWENEAEELGGPHQRAQCERALSKLERL